MTGPLVAVITDGAVALAVIAAAAVLGALGKIDGQTTVAVLGVGVALITGTTKSAVALYAPPPTAPPPAGGEPQPPAAV